MKKIINTFKYGSKEVKRVLGFTIIMSVATVAFLTTAIITKMMILFFAAIIGFFITVSLIQTLGIKENTMNFNDTSQQKEEVHRVGDAYVADFVAENVSSGRNNATDSVNTGSIDDMNSFLPGADISEEAYTSENDLLFDKRAERLRKKELKRQRRLEKKARKQEKKASQTDVAMQEKKASQTDVAM